MSEKTRCCDDRLSPPVDPAKPVVTAACVFCCRRAMGEAITRHSLRPRFRGLYTQASGVICAARTRWREIVKL